MVVQAHASESTKMKDEKQEETGWSSQPEGQEQ
jgi:hypothetical protein